MPRSFYACWSEEMTVHKVAKVGYNFPGEKPVVWDFPSEETLKNLGVTAEHIKEIRYSDHYPGDIYIELGIARDAHPAMGSFSAELFLKNGSILSVSDIWFQDFGHKTRPPIGIPHWNHQTRLMRREWPKPKFLYDHHMLPKTDSIELFREWSGEQKKDTLLWKEQERVVKKQNLE